MAILIFSSSLNAQTITTIVGGGSSGDGDSAIHAVLSLPEQLWYDTMGRMYIAEAGANRIRKVTTGFISTFAGTGSAGFFGDGGTATDAFLNGNSGVVGDKQGNIFITDFNNNRLRVVNSLGIINLFAGNGTSGWLGDGNTATIAEISAPGEMCIDTFGNIYFTDAGCQGVRKVSPLGIITTVAGDGSIFPGYGGDGGPATLALFQGPEGVAVDYAGNLYIADYDNSRIRKVTTDGIVNTIAGTTSAGYSGDGGPATLAKLNSPRGIFIDNHTGNVYWTEVTNDVVRKLTPDGIISTVAGTGVMGFSGDGSPATDAKLFYPGYVCMDNCGNLIISDTYNNRIRKVSYPFTGTLPSIAIATIHDTLCAGITATFTSTLTTGSPGGLSYHWYVNGVGAGATSSSYSYTPGNGDSVRCVLTYSNTCAGATHISSNTIHFIVDSTQIPTMSLPALTYSVTGSVVTVNAALAITGTASPSYFVNWYNHGIYFATTTVPSVSYTKIEPIDSITATIVPTGTPCFDSTQSNADIIKDSTLAIPNMLMNQYADVLIYPNPAQESVTITAQKQMRQTTLINIYGKVVWDKDVNTESETLVVSQLPDGLYFVEVNGVVIGRFLKK